MSSQAKDNGPRRPIVPPNPRPQLPCLHFDRLTAVYARTSGVYRGPATDLNFLDWQGDNPTFSSIAMYRNQDYSLTGRRLGAAPAVVLGGGFWSREIRRRASRIDPATALRECPALPWNHDRFRPGDPLSRARRPRALGPG